MLDNINRRSAYKNIAIDEKDERSPPGQQFYHTRNFESHCTPKRENVHDESIHQRSTPPMHHSLNKKHSKSHTLDDHLQTILELENQIKQLKELHQSSRP